MDQTRVWTRRWLDIVAALVFSNGPAGGVGRGSSPPPHRASTSRLSSEAPPRCCEPPKEVPAHRRTHWTLDRRSEHRHLDRESPSAAGRPGACDRAELALAHRRELECRNLSVLELPRNDRPRVEVGVSLDARSRGALPTLEALSQQEVAAFLGQPIEAVYRERCDGVRSSLESHDESAVPRSAAHRHLPTISGVWALPLRQLLLVRRPCRTRPTI